LGVYFICGLTALAYEVIWNRVLTLHLGSSVYAYSIMLAVYLLGVTLGSGIMSYYVNRLKNPVEVFSLYPGIPGPGFDTDHQPVRHLIQDNGNHG